MIIFNSNSATAKKVAQILCKNLSFTALEISSINLERVNPEEFAILLINIFGEEELSEEWEVFLQKNIIKNKIVIVYLFGVYDNYIDNNSTIVKQIYYYLDIHNKCIKIFPKKISKFNLDINELEKFMLKLKSKDIVEDIFHKEILNIINITHKIPKIYDMQTLDLTCSYDGFSNILDKEKFDSYRLLYKILSISNQRNITCNRLNLNQFNYNLIKNNNLEKIYFKSCCIEKTPNLINFFNLKTINFSANKIKFLELYKLPSTLKRINFSKNNIIKVILKYDINVESLALFNNNIIEFKWLIFLKNLKYLNIGMNPIKKLPREIFNLKKLEILNIALTEIDNIPKEILEITTLKQLDIKYCVKLRIDDPVLEKLIKNGVEVIC